MWSEKLPAAHRLRMPIPHRGLLFTAGNAQMILWQRRVILLMTGSTDSQRIESRYSGLIALDDGQYARLPLATPGKYRLTISTHGRR